MAGFDGPSASQFDDAYLAALPKFTPSAPQAQPTYGANPFIAGVMSGGLGLGADLAGFGGAIGRATGITPLARGGESWAQSLGAKAQAASLPQYEPGGGPDHAGSPWSLPGMAYQVAKAAPMMAGMLAGGELLAPAEAPAWMAAAGRVAPRLLGGAGGAVGEAAEKVGADWARHLIGGGVAGYPLMAGGAYNEQLASGGPDQNRAALALMLGSPEAAVGAVMPAQLRGLAESGLSGHLAKRILTSGAASGAAGVVQSGVQAALNQPFMDPNTSFAERAHSIVQSALMGGAVGGIFGAMGGAKGGNRDIPKDIPPTEQYGPPLPPAPSGASPDEFQPFQQRRIDEATQSYGLMPLTQDRQQVEAPDFRDTRSAQLAAEQEPNYSGPAQSSAETFEQFQQRRMDEAARPPSSTAPAPLPTTPLPIEDQAGVQPFQQRRMDDVTRQQQIGEAPAPQPGLPDPVLRAQADAATLNALRRPGGPTEGEVGLADRRGVLPLHATPYEDLSPAQQARLDAAHLLTDQGQLDARLARLDPAAATRLANAVNQPGGPGELARLTDPLKIQDLFDPAKADALSPTQVALRDAILQDPNFKPAAPVATPVGEAPMVPVATPAKAAAPSAPAPKTDQETIKDLQKSVLEKAGVRPTQVIGDIAKEASALKAADPTMSHEQALTEAVRQRLQDGKAGKQLEALGREYGVLDDKGQIIEQAKEAPDAVQERVAAPVDAREQAGPSAGVREGDAAGSQAPGKGQAPEAPAAQAPVESAAQAPAPVEGEVAPTAGPVEPPETDEQKLVRQQAEAAQIQAQSTLDQQINEARLANMRATELAKQQAKDAEMDARLKAGRPQVAPRAPAMEPANDPVVLSGIEKRTTGPAPKASPPAVAAMRQATANAAAKTATMEQGVVGIATAGGDAKDALTHIAQNSPTVTERKMAEHLLGEAKAQGLTLPMGVGIDSTVPAGWSGASSFNKATGRITLGRQEGAAQDLMHEVAHALSIKAADRGTQGWAELRGTFKKIAMGASDADVSDPTLKYALNAPVPEGTKAPAALELRAREFLAEAQSNPNLQAYLKGQAPDTWTKVKNALYRMVGMNDKVMKNAFDKVMDLSQRVFDESKALKLTDGQDPVPGHEPLPGSVPDVLNKMVPLFSLADNMKGVIQKRFDDASGDGVNLVFIIILMLMK